MFRLFLLVAVVAAPAAAKVITPVPGNFALDGSLGEWKGTPPTISAGNPARPSEALWFARKHDGLVIAGVIRGGKLDFAGSAAELATKWRLEVWLSLVDPFDLPDLPYEPEVCDGAGLPAQKIACLQWLKDQPEYRERLQRQFTRMWRIAPGAAEEAYALPAYDALTEQQRAAIGWFPRPAELPLSKFQTASEGEVTFEILIPWALFPPADRLNLEQLRLEVNARSWYAGSYPDGEKVRDNLPSFAISPPIRALVTACGQPLLGRDIHGGDVEAFYFLNRALQVDRVFFFDNPQKRDQWNPLPEPDEISPAAFYDTFTTQELDKGEYLCGPFMSYRKGAITKQFAFQLRPPQDQVSHAKVTPFPVKKLPDGTRLIRYGPDQSWSPLWRRAYVVYSMAIYALTPALEAKEAIHLGTWSDGVSGYGIEISGDWRTVTEFRQTDGPWTSETFCLTGHVYRSCRRNPDSRPPKQPLQDMNQ